MFVYVCLCNCLSKSQLPLFSRNAHAQVFLSPTADSHSALNGNHQTFSSNGDSRSNNLAKNLQDSLVLKVSSSSGPGKQPSPTSMLNGRNGSMKEESIYENSSCFVSHNLGNKTPPVPARSAHNNHTPVPHPRTSLSVASSGTSGSQRAQESPKIVRSARGEATSRSGQGTDSSRKPSSVRFSSTAPPSPRTRGSSLQKRSPSPMRDQPLSHSEVPQRLRNPEPTGSTKERPPVSPYMSHRGTPGSQGFIAKPVPDSPQGPRKLIGPSKAEAMRALYAQSPSSISGLEKESGGRYNQRPGGGIKSGLGSRSSSSPLASPHSQRKTPCMSGSSSKEQSLVKPYTRERKNSISEINDNEDELLEYHRWQREERLREQEMEKLVSDQHVKYIYVTTSQ